MARDLSRSIDSALGGNRKALISLARGHLGWTRDEAAALGRGDPEAVARAEAAVAGLRSWRRGAPVEPVVVGAHDGRTQDQLRRCLDHDDAVAGALCADGHLGYSQPVGGAVAYREHISVSGVGYDIACGNLAVRTGLPFAAVKDRVGPLLDAVAGRVSFGVGRKNARGRVEHPLFEDEDAWRAADARHLRDMARGQLGTLGAGNHYVDLFREVAEGDPETESPVWIGVHFGSRGLGHKLATQYLKRGGGRDGIDERPTLLLRQDSDLGRGYLAAMALAGRYAYAGREWVAAEVLDILGARATLEVHNHHNFAWREEVEGAPAWVVRKGCTPAFPGQAGFVGGSMGGDAVVLEGAESPLAAGLLRSTVHGAGRVMGRKQALRSLAREDMQAWLRARGVQLRGGGLDESPMAYRRLDEVLAHHAGTVRVLHRLRPFGVAMAGPGEFDPYKD